LKDGVELSFWAAVHSIETSEERQLATFYIMNTSLNLGNWRVTDKALEDALPTLLGKPLGCIPGYRVNHVHESFQVGRWVMVDKPDGYALATAEITDDVAWEKLSSGEWGPISVVIRAFKVTCSVCGLDLMEGADEHVLRGEGHEVVESFVIHRVDFVDRPAYPQASVLTLGHLAEATAVGGVLFTAAAIPFEETVKAPENQPWDADAAEARIRRWAGGPDKDDIDWSRYRRCFAWFDRSVPEEFGSYKLPHHDIIDGRLSVVWRGVAAAMQALLGARGGVDIPASDRRGVYNHLRRHYLMFDRMPPDYHASQSIVDGAQGPRGDPKPEGKRENKKMEEKIAELQSKMDTLQAENEELKEDLRRRKAERHQELVDRAVETRVKADLAKDRKAEAERLKELDDQTLILIAGDAEKVAEKLAKAPPTGPKAKYSADAKSGFDAAVEDMREQLFGYRKGGET